MRKEETINQKAMRLKKAYGQEKAVEIIDNDRKRFDKSRTNVKHYTNDVNNPTSISHRALASMQKRFYPGQNPSDYYAPTLGGKNASYRQPPWWLKTEDFIDFLDQP
jgi:hypothetical protein